MGIPARLLNAILFASTLLLGAAVTAGVSDGGSLSPTALAATSDGKMLFIACAAAKQVVVFDVPAGTIARTIAVPTPPSGLVLSADGTRLFVTCAAPQSWVCVIDTSLAEIVSTIPAGHTAMSPVLSPDGKQLYVCNRFNNDIAVIDLATQKEIARVPVPREPFAAALTLDGTRLLVANHLQAGRADAEYVAASVSVIDTAARKVVREIRLPNGSNLLRDVRISPDGKIACVTHQISRFHLPTTQIERGWINTNALSLIDVGTLALINTVLLDNVDSGAANPWAAAWSADGKTICVTHAGTNELSVIDGPALFEKLAKLPVAVDPKQPVDYNVASHIAADVPNDLSFLVGVRERLKLAGIGPRALALIGTKMITADYFTDSLSVVDLATQKTRARAIALGPKREMNIVRRGEMLWNDATICFQGWQSCSSCHSHDARVDGMNWDLLNDGIGNPKNSKSLLFAHRTPPTTWLGARENAFVSVREGIRHILFTVRPEEDAHALDEFLMSLRPAPSPHLVDGALSESARRGEKLFHSDTLGCADCHRGELFTDLRPHNVGTRGPCDKPTDNFYTPSLVEIWRTAPYLHDGSAATVRDVLTTRNAEKRHGHASHLAPREIDDLCTYVLSL